LDKLIAASKYLTKVRLITSLFFIVLLLCIYLKTISYQPVFLDDQELVVKDSKKIIEKNDLMKSFSEGIFPETEAVIYRPILKISFLFDRMLSQKSYFYFHLTNIIIHVLNCFLIFAFLKKHIFSHHKIIFLIIFFAVHPLINSSVAWIPGRNDSLLTLFFLISFISLVNFYEKNKFLYLITNLLFFTFALFTKETAIMFPILFLMYTLLLRYQMIKKLVVLIPSWLLISFVWFCKRSAVLNGSFGVAATDIPGFFHNGVKIFLVNFGKMLFPSNLSPYPIIEDTTIVWGILSTTVVLLLYFLRWIKNRRLATFSLISIVLVSLPTMIFIFKGQFEHRNYLPLFFMTLFLANVSIPLKKGMNNLLIIFLLLIFFIISFFNVNNYKNAFTFWRKSQRENPSSGVPHNNLGTVLFLANKLDLAENEFLTAIKKEPSESAPVYNLGKLYFTRRDYNKAENFYDVAVQMDSIHYDSYYYTSLIAFLQDRFSTSLERINLYLKHDPDNTKAIIIKFLCLTEMNNLTNIELLKQHPKFPVQMKNLSQEEIYLLKEKVKKSF